MTIFTDIPVRRSALSEFEAPLSDVLGATAEEALLFSPTSSATRSGELIKAQEGEPRGFLGFGGRYEPETSLLRPDDARQRMRDAGVDLTIPEQGIRGGALDILIERKREEQRRQDVVSRAPGGFAAGAARIGVGLGASILDPLNIAAAFIPVVGEARYAKLVANAAGAAGRMGVRAGVGALEGAVGAALMEPIIYHAATQEQADYDISDSLLNIAFGTALGGGLHVGVGAVADAVGAGAKFATATATEPLPQLLEQVNFRTRETALRTGVAQALSGREIDVEALLPSGVANLAPPEAQVKFSPAPDRPSATTQDFATTARASDNLPVEGVSRQVGDTRAAADTALASGHIGAIPDLAAASDQVANSATRNVAPARQTSRRRENLPPAGKLEEAALKSFAPETLRMIDIEGVRGADQKIASGAGPKVVQSASFFDLQSRQTAQIETGLAEALEDAKRAADAIGAPDAVQREMTPYESLIDSAAVYGRAIVAAATCQLRRGA